MLKRIAVLAMTGATFALVLEFSQVFRTLPALASSDQQATRVVIEKSARRLTLERDGRVLARYEVALGANPAGQKAREGDGRTPEGVYSVDFKHPRSRYHLALRITYPDARASEAAKQAGVSPGGDIMIHGIRNGLGWVGGLHRERDWTDGCIAVTNAEIREIWSRVPEGTPVEIRP
ncbi:MAG TPA: L,D-transpeptidase family protein [Bosea sp. (in: a-proteobacteria)]|jgi:murein L,D-transpeptidase YafK|uniref:L,D-transpeptidase family protein n=1 Tax=Bosea sp. (in: a-proteobacteria) TaxID=1871050 RepID=UPI002E0E0CD7|nr:L,D-transpeptidase family protein [Bosea sp. (in: a-proteobacteria)]